jgi:hypothetical protein
MLPEDSYLSTSRKAALVVAHPGHELRVYHWLELARPTVFVLTDGSGCGQRSRLDSTSRVLESAGAARGPVYGSFTDAELYAAVIAGDAPRLLATARTLARAFSDSGVDYVVGDALEGFSPSHDLCRFLINLAIELIHRATGHELENFDFLLDGSPESCAEPLRASALRITLDDASLERKLRTAAGYAELKAETEAALERFGSRAFLTEYLRPVPDRRQGLDRMEREPPSYEAYGEERVRRGSYDQVIRNRANVRPLVNALWQVAELTDRSGD